MPDVITLRLEPQTQALLSELERASPESVQALINAAIRQYLFSERFKEAQRRLSALGKDALMLTEDELLRLPRASLS